MDREQRIAAALQDLESGALSSLRQAAVTYDIDYSTLSRRRRGQQSRVEAHAQEQKLTPELEALLASWLIDAERAGHAFNHAQLRDIVKIIDTAAGGDGTVGKHWIKKFLKRHPEIHTKKGVSIANQRVHELYSSRILQWFAYLLSLLHVYNIKCANIFNMDETGNALGPCTNQTIIGSSKSKRAYVARPEDREWVSVIECIGATGTILTPLVIFKGKHVQHQWFIPDQTPDWLYTCTDNAFSTNDVGLQWLRDIFIPQTAKGVEEGEYRLLLLDGHSSHVSTEFMYECFKNKIIPYYLIAHASHILQPLDLAIFSSLKATYRAAVNFHSQLDDTAPVKKQQFLNYYRDARDNALSLRNIRAGFRAAGIVPFNPQKILSSPFVLSDRNDPLPQRATSPDRAIISQQVIQTPKSRRDLYRAIMTIDAVTPLPRPVRDLLNKTGRTIDRLVFRTATTERQLTAYKRLADDWKAKSKKKAPVDPNSLFVNIENIKKKHDQQQEESAPTRGATTRSTAARTPQAATPASIDPFQRLTEQFRSIAPR